MATVFQKIRLAVVGNAHELLDRAIDMNSIPVLKQYVRDLETALDKLRNEAAVAAGQVRTLNREKTELEAQLAHTEETITHILQSSAPNKDAIAKQEALKIPGIKRQITSTTDALAAQRETSSQLDLAVQKLDQKHTDMVSRIQQLSTLDRSAKAKESAANAIRNAGNMASAGSDISVDNLESRIRARADVADEKFERAMGTVGTLDDPAASAEADDILAGLKAKIGQ